jgi:D-alanyl-D-alanine carboxypeptidase
MTYSSAALLMLQQLGIPLEWVSARNLKEYGEATLLDLAERDPNGREHLLFPSAANKWRELKTAARREGIDLYIVSAFRSVQRQSEIIKRKLAAGVCIEQILTVSAPPFFSEHHTGYAVDVGTPDSPVLETEFEDTAASQWLSKSAGLFGFVMSYPMGNASGYAYEPWHWRYVGERL